MDANQQSASPVNDALGNLPQFPSDGEPEIVIRPRRIPIVEITAGALLGLLLGTALGWLYLASGIVPGLLALLIPIGFGALIGWIVGFVTGPTGEYSVRTVLAALPRVFVGICIGWFFGVLGLIFVVQRRRDNDD